MSEIAVKEREETLVAENEFATEIITPVEYKNKFKFYYVIKRLADIVLSLLGIIALSPLFLIIAILIRIDSKGSAMFRQKRVGKNGKDIYIYKFRSMVLNAEKVLEELMEKDSKIKEEYLTKKKLDNDPRITKIGKFIRKTSIDELPQLINVLKGDMSLIGPRPYLPREIVDMGDNYQYIITCRPGITGYWQVNGRSNTTFDERCEMEKFYSQHISAAMDVKILFKTIKVVLCRKGAK